MRKKQVNSGLTTFQKLFVPPSSKIFTRRAKRQKNFREKFFSKFFPKTNRVVSKTLPKCFRQTFRKISLDDLKWFEKHSFFEKNLYPELFVWIVWTRRMQFWQTYRNKLLQKAGNLCPKKANVRKRSKIKSFLFFSYRKYLSDTFNAVSSNLSVKIFFYKARKLFLQSSKNAWKKFQIWILLETFLYTFGMQLWQPRRKSHATRPKIFRAVLEINEEIEKSSGKEKEFFQIVIMEETGKMYFWHLPRNILP